MSKPRAVLLAVNSRTQLTENPEIKDNKRGSVTKTGTRCCYEERRGKFRPRRGLLITPSVILGEEQTL